MEFESHPSGSVFLLEMVLNQALKDFIYFAKVLGFSDQLIAFLCEASQNLPHMLKFNGNRRIPSVENRWVGIGADMHASVTDGTQSVWQTLQRKEHVLFIEGLSSAVC